MYLEGLKKTTDTGATMMGVSVNVQNSSVPNTSQKSCNLSELSGPKVEANLGFKDLGAKQIEHKKCPPLAVKRTN